MVCQLAKQPGSGYVSHPCTLRKLLAAELTDLRQTRILLSYVHPFLGKASSLTIPSLACSESVYRSLDVRVDVPVPQLR